MNKFYTVEKYKEPANELVRNRMNEGFAKKLKTKTIKELSKDLMISEEQMKRYLGGIIPNTKDLRERVSIYLGYKVDDLKPSEVALKLAAKDYPELLGENKEVVDELELDELVDKIINLSEDDYASLCHAVTDGRLSKYKVSVMNK